MADTAIDRMNGGKMRKGVSIFGLTAFLPSSMAAGTHFCAIAYENSCASDD